MNHLSSWLQAATRLAKQLFPLSPPQRALLRVLLDGATLKAHRYLDGTKMHQLHALDGTTTDVPESLVEALKRRRLIESNKKFPAATYLLTERGRRVGQRLSASTTQPLGPKRFGE